MSVEEARHVLTGDHIQAEDGGPTLIVVCTHHSPSQSVITALMAEGPAMLVLEYLPDDPVLVLFYSNAPEEETANADD
jgi:uncharacterized protein YodC (DUF2158 family)